MIASGADPLAAIRQRAEVLNDAVSFMGDEVDDSERLAVADRAELLSLWDTRESALRALVAQWKQEAVIADATCNDTIAVQLHECADAVERLLESEP